MKKYSGIILLLNLFLLVLFVVIPQFVESDQGHKQKIQLRKNFAQKSEKAIEDLEKLSNSNSRAYRNNVKTLDDGKKQADVHVGPVQYEDEDRQWQDIDTTLKAKVDGVEQSALELSSLEGKELYNDSNLIKSQFSLNPSENLLMEIGQESIVSSYLDTNLVQGKLTGDSDVIYEEAYRNVDIERIILPGSIKQNIILKELGHPKVFKERMITSLYVEIQPDNSIFYYSGSELVAQTSPIYILDSEGVRADVDLSYEDGVLTIQLPQRGLKRLAYPLVIDPSVDKTPASADDGEVTKSIDAYGAVTYASSTSGVYMAAVGVNSDCSSNGTFCKRTYVRFPLSGTGSSITAATLKTFGYSTTTTNGTLYHSAPFDFGSDSAATMWGKATDSSQTFTSTNGVQSSHTVTTTTAGDKTSGYSHTYYTIWADATGATWTYTVDYGGTTYDPILSITYLDEISISGTCKQFDQTTNCTDDGSNAVSVAFGNVFQAQNQTTVGGTWTISGLTRPATDTIVTVFINGEATAGERASAVTKYNGTGNIAGVVLYWRHLTIGSNQNNSVTTENLASYDYSVPPNDADIIFDVDASNNLTVDNLNAYTDERLLILASNTLSGNSPTIYTFDMELEGALTGIQEVVVGGSWTQNGSYNLGGQTGDVTFNATSGGKTISGTNLSFYNVAFNGVGGAWSFGSSSATVTNYLGITNGTVTAPSTTLTLGGHYSNSGTFSHNSGTVTFNATDTPNPLTGTMTGTSGKFNNLTFNGAGGAWSFAANSAEVAGNLTLTAGTVTAPSTTLTIVGNFTNNANFTHNSGTVVIGGTSGTTSTLAYSANTTFYNLSTSVAGKLLKFDDTQSTIIASGGSLTIQGTDCTTGRVFLDSETDNNDWPITTTGATVNIDYADIEDSTATGSPTADNSTAVNGGNTGWTINAGACVANQGPNTPATLTQKTSPGDVAISESSWTTDNTPNLGFTITDPDSDTVKYEVQVTTAADTTFATPILDYTHGSLSASGTTFAFTVGSYGSGSCSGTCPTTLSDSATGYLWRVKAIDSNAASSAYVEFGVASTMDMKVDATAPTGGTVNDGTSGDQDWNNGSLTTLESNWSGFDFDVSGLNKYEYTIRRTSDEYYWNTGGGGAWQSGSIWYDNTTFTTVTVNLLNLQTSELYYFSVRATDNAGNISSLVSSNGQKVTSTLSFGYDSSQITFADLNNGNNWTDTKTTTFTTSTNASNGYSVYGYITDFLRSASYGSVTIADFSGTWGTPLEWSGYCKDNANYCGFGYTSNDTLVSGSNRFSGGANFCKYQHTSSGDVVADHTAAVNGSTGAVVNEEFIVTHKVSVPPTQTATEYKTTAIFIITANY